MNRNSKFGINITIIIVSMMVLIIGIIDDASPPKIDSSKTVYLQCQENFRCVHDDDTKTLKCFCEKFDKEQITQMKQNQNEHGV